jgi:hypothetical protein
VLQTDCNSVFVCACTPVVYSKPLWIWVLTTVMENAEDSKDYRSGFGGLVLSMLVFGTRVRGFKPGRSRPIFFGWKNPQHAFLRKGSKAVCPMSQICGMLKTVWLHGSWVTGKICRPLLARFLPSLTEVSGACVAWSASGVDGRN